MESNFVKAVCGNLPIVDAIKVGNFFTNNSDFCSPQLRNVKAVIYTGYCPQYIFRSGDTYASTTHKILLDPVTHKSGKLVLSDRTASDFQVIRRSQTIPGQYEARNYYANSVYKQPMVPGYTGSIPGTGAVGKRFSVDVYEGLLEFERENIRRKSDKHNLIKEIEISNGGSGTLEERMNSPLEYTLPLLEVRPQYGNILRTIAIPEPPPDAGDVPSPYFKQVTSSDKKFMPGYTGHIPFGQSKYGQGYTPFTNSALCDFTTNYRMRQSTEWAPVNVVKAEPPLIISSAEIYHKHMGMVPNYTGHIPGQAFSSSLFEVYGKQNTKSSVEEISDIKDFKKVLRTKNNVLVCFVSSLKEASNILKVFKEAADVIKGQGTMLQVDCSGEGKKLCKKLKVSPEPYVLRHYKDGDFHKVYDRRESAASMVNFMRDPTGEIPWEEDDKTVDIVHLPDPASLQRLIKKETRPIMVMFYAPWCGFCKLLKPEFSEAATALKGTHVLAAIDVNRPENIGIRMKFNITGFPTLLYFHDGELKYTYDGENKKDDIISFMKDPSAAPAKPKHSEKDWSEEDNEVKHLTSEIFDDFTKADESTLVMFYAPWCGHCKKMKPEYEKAAEQMKLEKIKGTLAAVDATKEPQLAKRFNVKGYPTIKYFKFGEFVWDTPQLRESNAILSFMKDPKEPPVPPAPEPSWEDQPSEVVHLNTENFKSFLKKKKHALVMFYAPWCGHCKMAKPEFQEAAEELKEDMKIAFAAMDCTKYSSVCQAVGVSGYPTIKYYNYYNKEPPQDYSGGRKKNDFVNYMRKKSEATKIHSSIPIKEEL